MTDYFHLNTRPDAVRAISTLGLAHLGDGVFELMVRSWLCLHGKATSRGLHKATVGYVAAPAQARAAEKILPQNTMHAGFGLFQTVRLPRQRLSRKPDCAVRQILPWRLR